MLSCVHLYGNRKKELTAAFAQFDRDNDGHISTDEARLFLSNEPFNFSTEKVNYSQFILLFFSA